MLDGARVRSEGERERESERGGHSGKLLPLLTISILGEFLVVVAFRSGLVGHKLRPLFCFPSRRPEGFIGSDGREVKRPASVADSRGG